MPTPAITSATTASATLGTLFSYQITASNTPTSFGAKLLPPALSLITSSGLIDGYVDGAGVYGVRLSASIASGTSDEVTLTLTVTGDTTDPIPADAAGLMSKPTSNIYGGVGANANTVGGMSAVVTRVNSAALEAAHILKATAGTLFLLTATNTSSAGYIQFFDSASVPAENSVPIASYFCAGNGNFSFDAQSRGVPFVAGIVVVFSTAQFVKTTGGNQVTFLATVQ